MEKCGLATSEAEKSLLVSQLENALMIVGEGSKFYFLLVDKCLNALKSVEIVKEERGIVRVIIRNLLDEYHVEKHSHFTNAEIVRF